MKTDDRRTCEQMPIRQGFANRYSSPPSSYIGCAIRNFEQPGPAADPAACRKACCDEPECRSWGLDLKHPGDASGCRAGTPCCWLERCTALAPEHLSNCSWGCVSGTAGRKDDPSHCKGCTSTSCAACSGGPPPPLPPQCPTLRSNNCTGWGCTWDPEHRACSRPPPPPPPPPVITESFECELRALILRWAKTLQPARAGDMSSLFDALRLGESPDGMLACNFSSRLRDFPPVELGYPLPASTIGATGPEDPESSTLAPTVIYVSATSGDDDNAGTTAAVPLRSLPAAQALLRKLRRRRSSFGGAPGEADQTAEVRLSGTFYLEETLELSALDSNTRWVAAAAAGGRGFGGSRAADAVDETATAAATISGGTLLEKLEWEPVTLTQPGGNGHQVFKATLPRATPPFDTLFDPLDGSRLVRARYPNGNLERDMRPSGWISSELDPGIEWQTDAANPTNWHPPPHKTPSQWMQIEPCGWNNSQYGILDQATHTRSPFPAAAGADVPTTTDWLMGICNSRMYFGRADKFTPPVMEGPQRAICGAVWQCPHSCDDERCSGDASHRGHRVI
jgi:hypothetical protein